MNFLSYFVTPSTFLPPPLFSCFIGPFKRDVRLLADKSFRGLSDFAVDYAYERLVAVLSPLAPSQFALSLKKTTTTNLAQIKKRKEVPFQLLLHHNLI